MRNGMQEKGLIKMTNTDFEPAMTEIQQARELWAKTMNVTVKKLLGPFSNQCPACGSARDMWHLLRIKQGGKYDIVTYLCKVCLENKELSPEKRLVIFEKIEAAE